MKEHAKFVQLVSDPKLGLCALAVDGSVWRWVPERSDAGGRPIYARWEQVGP